MPHQAKTHKDLMISQRLVEGYWYHHKKSDQHFIIPDDAEIDEGGSMQILGAWLIDPKTLAWNTEVEEPYARGEKGKQMIWCSFEYKKGIWSKGGSTVEFSFHSGVFHTEFSDEITITERVKYIDGNLMVGEYSLKRAIEEGLEIIAPASEAENSKKAKAKAKIIEDHNENVRILGNL